MVNRKRSQKSYLIVNPELALAFDITTQLHITSNDLIISKHDNDGKNFIRLKDGVQIVRYLRLLTEKYGYKLVFSSKKTEEEQLGLLKQINSACQEQKLKDLPKVTAMVVNDPITYKRFSIKSPKVIKSKDHGILIAGHGTKSDNAETLDSVAKLLKIKDSERENCIVLKTSSPIVRRYKSKGWKCYKNYSVSFCDTLKAVVEDLEEQKEKFKETTSEISDPSKFCAESPPLTKGKISKQLRTEVEIESDSKMPSFDNESDFIALRNRPASNEGILNEYSKEDDLIEEKFESISPVEMKKLIVHENPLFEAMMLEKELQKNEKLVEEKDKINASTSLDSFYASPSWNYPIIRKDSDFESTEKLTISDSSLSSTNIQRKDNRKRMVG